MGWGAGRQPHPNPSRTEAWASLALVPLDACHRPRVARRLGVLPALYAFDKFSKQTAAVNAAIEDTP